MSVATSDQLRITGRCGSNIRTLLIVTLVNVSILSLWSAGLATGIAAENGLLETMQLLLAAAACGVFSFAALEDDGPVGTAATAAAAIAVIAMLREVDVRKMEVPDWVMIWADSMFRDTVIAFLLLAMFAYLWTRREHFPGWTELLFRRSAWPLWASAGLFALSVAVDGDKVIAVHESLLVEELLELNAFMLLLVAGWRHCRLLTGTRRRGEE